MAAVVEQCEPGWLEWVPTRDVERLTALLRSAPRSREEFAQRMLRCGPWPRDGADAQQRVATILLFLMRGGDTQEQSENGKD